jgi:hypothetical protein
VKLYLRKKTAAERAAEDEKYRDRHGLEQTEFIKSLKYKKSILESQSAQTKLYYRTADIFLFTFFPVFAVFSYFRMTAALITAGAASVMLFLLFFTCGWKKMSPVPTVCMFAGILAGFLAGIII